MDLNPFGLISGAVLVLTEYADYTKYRAGSCIPI